MRKNCSLRQILYLFLVFLTISTIGCDNSSDTIGYNNPPNEVQQAAESGLVSLKKNITSENKIPYGFDENDNPDEAILGNPFHLYQITHETLLKYQEIDDTAAALTETPAWYYPVIINSKIKSILIVEKTENAWTAGSIPMVSLAEKLEKILQRWPPETGYDILLGISYETFSYVFAIPQKGSENLTPIDELSAESGYGKLESVSETMQYLNALYHGEYGTLQGSLVFRRTRQIKTVGGADYKIPMRVSLIDSRGNPVSSAYIYLKTRPHSYYKGSWITVNNGCKPEYTDKTVVSDINDDKLAAAAGTVPEFVLTDKNGTAYFSIVYPKTSAAWVETEMTANAVVVNGTELSSVYSFRLPFSESDMCGLPDSPYNLSE